MTMVFVIDHPERCQLCYKPVRGYIYEHQCRPKTQPLSCFSCLLERGNCRYCHSPFSAMKFPNGSTLHQNYNTKPSPRYIASPRISNVDTDEIIRNSQLGINVEMLIEPPPREETSLNIPSRTLSRTNMWNKTLPSSDFRGYAIDGEEDERDGNESDIMNDIYHTAVEGVRNMESENRYNFDDEDEDPFDLELCSDEEDEILISMIDFIGNKTPISQDVDDIPLREISGDF